MANSNLYINYKQENPIYSPGIGTYSAQGNSGEKGDNGNSVYFYPNVINGNAQALEFIKNKIKENKLLCSIYNNDNPHIYLVNDVIIDSRGDVYTIESLSENAVSISDCIGNISPVCPLCIKIESEGEKTIELKLSDGYSDSIASSYIFNISYLSDEEKWVTTYNVSIGDKISNVSTDTSIYGEICSKNTGMCSKYILY